MCDRFNQIQLGSILASISRRAAALVRLARVSSTTMTNWKLTLAYDGTDFHGWQVQPHQRTLQGTLADAIASVTGERVLPQGSGRTDAGVHALGQVASFELSTAIPATNLMRALNRALPAAVRVVAAEPAAPDFHARHSARGKVYQYRVFQGRGLSGEAERVCPPFLARTVHVHPWALDLPAMQQAAQLVIGQHDFTSFAAVDPDLTTRQNAGDVKAANMVRKLTVSEWKLCPENSGTDAAELLVYTVRGSGFLHHMVRNLVGTFLDVGRGRIHPEAIPQILAARDRSQAGATAAPTGLFLINVEYTESSPLSD